MSGGNCYSTGSPQAAALQELLPHGSVPRGPSVRSKLLQHGSPTGAAPPRPPAPAWAPPWAAAWRSAPCGTHGLQGDSLLHQGPLHRPQGNFVSSTWSTSSPSFFTDLGTCKAVSHSSLSQLLLCSRFFFSPFLNLLSQRHKQHHLLAQVWAAVSPVGAS